MCFNDVSDKLNCVSVAAVSSDLVLVRVLDVLREDVEQLLEQLLVPLTHGDRGHERGGGILLADLLHPFGLLRTDGSRP